MSRAERLARFTADVYPEKKALLSSADKTRAILSACLKMLKFALRLKSAIRALIKALRSEQSSMQKNDH